MEIGHTYFSVGLDNGLVSYSFAYKKRFISIKYEPQARGYVNQMWGNEVSLCLCSRL